MTKNSKFVTAFSTTRNELHVGIIAEDGGVRVDYHGDLGDLTFWETDWNDASNPWKGGMIEGDHSQIFGLVPRYT
jgi:hypothetical protein